jgi:hypothetical protein
MTIHAVSAREALKEWDFYEAMINKVLRRAHAGTSSEDVLTCLQRGNMQLWRDDARKGVAVTEIQVYPQYKQLLIFMVAGRDVRDWLDEGHQQLDSFARQNGCEYMEFMGRPGWERLMEGYGYNEKFVRMRKSLNEPGRRKRSIRGHEPY